MTQKNFRDHVMSAVQVKVWHKHLKDGQGSVESDTHSGNITSRTPANVELSSPTALILCPVASGFSKKLNHL